MATRRPVGGPWATEGVHARFELGRPRRFMFPAILLLLSEEPGYGYGLVPRLREFRSAGSIDRRLYRALAQLERGWPGAGLGAEQQPRQASRVYSVTPLGERISGCGWGSSGRSTPTSVRSCGGYQATGTVERGLSEVEGGWVPELDLAWSPVSTTSMWRRRLMPPDNENDDASLFADLAGGSLDSDRSDSSDGLSGELGSAADSGPSRPNGRWENPPMGRFVLDPERSAVLIDARSTVGPICFGTTGVHGSLHAAMGDAGVSTEIPPTGWLTIDMTRLTSGNKLYDAELHRRINSRRFPTAKVELKECTPSAPGWRYRLRGELTFHGITRRTEGTVRIESASDDRIVISGEQAFDIRDFALPSPTMLMLRIFPDVRVRLYAEAQRSDDDD